MMSVLVASCPTLRYRPRKKRDNRTFLGRVVLLYVVLCTLAKGCAESFSSMRCHKTDDTIVCEVPFNSLTSEHTELPETCIDEEYCVQLSVTNRKQRNKSHHIYHRDEKEDPSSVIMVGSIVYHFPYTQYGHSVFFHLTNRPEIGPGTPQLEEDILLAKWYYQLGSAHSRLMDENRVDENEKASFELFKLALSTYERIAPHVSDMLSVSREDRMLLELDDLRISIADVYLHQVSNGYEQTARPESQSITIAHLRAAEALYRAVLEKPASPLPEEERRELEVDLATTLVRLAEELIDMNSFLMDLDTAGTLASSSDLDWSHLMKHAYEADGIYVEAENLFRKSLEASSENDGTYHAVRSQLTDTVQQHGMLSAFMSKIDNTIASWEEALAMYLEMYEGDPLMDDDVISDIGDLLHSLSDAYLQKGNYEMSQKYYDESMDWYKKYGVTLPDADIQSFDMLDDELLSLHENDLSAYHEMLNGGPAVPLPDNQGILNMPDDLYEADLHASLGVIRLGLNEVQLAIDHFQTAITLYGGYESEDGRIADIKINMAVAYLRMGEYKESSRVHAEALDLYRAEVGEGNNPFEGSMMVPDSGTKDTSVDKAAVNEHLINVAEYLEGLNNQSSTDEL